MTYKDATKSGEDTEKKVSSEQVNNMNTNRKKYICIWGWWLMLTRRLLWDCDS